MPFSEHQHDEQVQTVRCGDATGGPDMKLHGKVAMVTGAGRGIGYAVATAMAEAGARVALVDVSAAEVEIAAERLLRRGFEARSYASDVSTLPGNREVVDAIRSVWGNVDILHANAGVVTFADLPQITDPAEISRIIEINLQGAIFSCKAVLPAMIEQGSGVILLTASIAAFVGEPSVPVYSATKGGLTALCKSLAVRHGPDGVRCNTICPGDVRTQMLEDFLAREPDPEAARSELIARYPLRRIAEPEDIARLAAFLASDDAGWITGTDLVIDGGLLARCY